MDGVPVMRCWNERVSVGAERVMDWRILDDILVVVNVFRLTVRCIVYNLVYLFN